MRKELLIIALSLLVTAGPAAADVLATPETPAAPAIELPKKGASMAEVQKKFGSPATRQKTVGGDTPRHPPITRWDYADFYVVFERDKTIDAVIPGKHPTVYNKGELKPAAKPAPASSAQPAVPAEAPVMKTTEQPIAPVEAPATAAKMETPSAEPTAPPTVIPSPEPAPAAAPAPAPEPAPAQPSPAPRANSGGPALAAPVPDSPPTPK